VHTLYLSELQSHLDLGDLLYDFPHLSTLDLRWGAKKVGMDFDRSLFGMSLGDSVGLAKLLGQGSGNITRLSLRENLLGDEQILLLMGGLNPSNLGANQSLTFLDLSHNKIGDIGAKRLAQLLDGGASQSASGVGDFFAGSTVLTELNLSDNHIHSAGAVAFGAALANNRGLRRLDLSLNSLGDAGGVALLGGCTQHTSLRELVLSSTELGPEAGEALLNLLKFNRSLDAIQLACNDGLWETESSAGGTAPSQPPSARGEEKTAPAAPSIDVGAPLLDALRQNEQIVSLDMRRNKLSPNVESEMKALLAKRLAGVKQGARKMFQKDWDQAM
jgi:Leucine-rich repeat (LRR) protein